jgi:hypothetical protein
MGIGGLIVSALFIAGSSYLGSYYGARRAVRSGSIL